MQSFPDDTNIGNTDRKTTTDINASAVANPRSINTVDPEQELTKRRAGRLDKAVVQLSSRGTLFQTILTIPPSVIELNYGINYLNQCPIQPLINVFLIVHGCSSMANGIVLLIGFITTNYIKRSISQVDSRYLELNQTVFNPPMPINPLLTAIPLYFGRDSLS
jgi:hypothetical protein